jgi:hypothetical protein
MENPLSMYYIQSEYIIKQQDLYSKPQVDDSQF